MTITIGRAVLPDPSEITSSGDTLTLSGLFRSSAATATNRAAEAQVREMQLLGMIDNQDESVFPLVWTVDARFDGFYFCDAASWAYVNDGSATPSVASWSVSLRRLQDGANALVEMANMALVRTNGHSITSATNSIVGVYPPSTLDIDPRTLSFTGTVNRSTENGTLPVYLGTSTTTAAQASIGLTLSPASYYFGACVVEYLAADSNWYPMVGRKLPRDSGGRWRITNGCFRLQPASTVGNLTASVYTGASWESVEITGNTFQSAAHYSYGLSALQSGWLAPSIARNSPDAAVISTAGNTPTIGSAIYRMAQTWSVRRGAHHAELVVRSNGGYPGLRFAANTASTALATSSAGLRVTSNDASGNRGVLMGADAVTNDTTNGRIYVNSAATTARAFAVAIELDGSSAVTANASAALLSQFIGLGNVSTKVVKR